VRERLNVELYDELDGVVKGATIQGFAFNVSFLAKMVQHTEF